MTVYDKEDIMGLPRVVSREEWRAEREALLRREKEATRARDALNAQRRALPMVEVDKEYRFDGPAGRVGLADLFDGRRQLIVHHVMWRFDTDEACPICSLLVDNTGHPAHLHACDTSLVLVSRAPLANLERFRARMGWTLPWYSSHGGDFHYDFGATSVDTGEDGSRVNVFLRDGNRVFHTYSTNARGAEPLLGTFNLLDLTPLGRQRHVTEFGYRDR